MCTDWNDPYSDWGDTGVTEAGWSKNEKTNQLNWTGSDGNWSAAVKAKVRTKQAWKYLVLSTKHTAIIEQHTHVLGTVLLCAYIDIYMDIWKLVLHNFYICTFSRFHYVNSESQIYVPILLLHNKGTHYCHCIN